ncbi:hypothetical protein [Saliphagus sp. LR7]|uniref:hypothetical protein n=1 Tax=Saliphagus sp. LR7 TaxID=2282654 RepID=UPI000DF7D708|nr:hypothetical protein [Saliphagus sp. LR7]
MSDCVVYDVTVLFAAIAGTSATVLSLLSWSVFKRSPVGKLVFGLLFVMSLFTVQKGLVLLFSCEVIYVRLLKSVLNTGFFVIVVILVVAVRRWDGNELGDLEW